MRISADIVGESIACAAIRYKGLVYSVDRPGRHHDVIREMAAAGFGPECMHDQGFLTNVGRYVGRRRAAKIAMAANQPLRENVAGDGVVIRRQYPLDKLYSEDLW